MLYAIPIQWHKCLASSPSWLVRFRSIKRQMCIYLFVFLWLLSTRHSFRLERQHIPNEEIPKAYLFIYWDGFGQFYILYGIHLVSHVRRMQRNGWLWLFYWQTLGPDKLLISKEWHWTNSVSENRWLFQLFGNFSPFLLFKRRIYRNLLLFQHIICANCIFDIVSHEDLMSCLHAIDIVGRHVCICGLIFIRTDFASQCRW